MVKMVKYSVLSAFLLICFICQGQNKTTVLVLSDKNDPLSGMVKEYLIPYLDQFGIIFKVADVSIPGDIENASDYSLVIIGHPLNDKKSISRLVRKITKWGAGVVSFDPGWNRPENISSSYKLAEKIWFNTEHYITSLHNKADTIRSDAPMKIAELPAVGYKPLAFAGNQPFAIAGTYKGTREVIFSSSEWMSTNYIGPMMGLDDILWRSIVWAARKPFVMRGLPPLVTMRVDDVAGRGELMNETPLYWIRTSNKYGFKPWLGLFIYNLSPTAVDELRVYLLSGQATASPHALGRPNRSSAGTQAQESYTGAQFVQTNRRFYYSPDALPLRADNYDEFIYFDHHRSRPWSDEEAQRGLDAVDKWYLQNQPLPMSKYFLAHWYEMGANIIPHVSKKWGMEYIGINHQIDKPYADSIPWIKGAPFRLVEDPGTVTNNKSLRGLKAVYYSDFVTITNCEFFNSLTEIRDDAGYEWAPDNQVEASAGKGIRQLKRALSSMALAVLFTHETDFIYRIRPDNWDKQLSIISESIKDYNPMLMTMDDALRIVRAHRSSKLISAEAQKDNNIIKLTLSGKTDTDSYFWLFTGDNDKTEQHLMKLPPFTNGYSTTISY